MVIALFINCDKHVLLMKIICIGISFVYDKSFHIIRRITLECITFYAISGGKKLQLVKVRCGRIKFRIRTKTKDQFDENNTINETKSKLLDKIKTAIASRQEFSYSA